MERSTSDPNEPMAKKMNLLTQVFQFSLQVVTTLDRESGNNEKPSESPLTMAGYDQGSIRIMQVRLTPLLKNGIYVYEAAQSQDLQVDNNLIFLTAGLESVAQLILLDPKSEYSQGSPVLSQYYQDKFRAETSTIPTTEIESIAREITRRSADRYKGLVGVPTQIAILSEGRVSKFEQPVAPLPALSMEVLGLVNNVGLSYAGNGIGTAGRVAFFVSDEFLSHRPAAREAICNQIQIRLTCCLSTTARLSLSLMIRTW